MTILQIEINFMLLLKLFECIYCKIQNAALIADVFDRDGLDTTVKNNFVYGHVVSPIHGYVIKISFCPNFITSK
jgi:hypothetical protein